MQDEDQPMNPAKAILDEMFSVRDVPVFCWLTTTLLTLEVAWMRTVYGRCRREDGVWEYYNYPQNL